jgi:hypothetical protein
VLSAQSVLVWFWFNPFKTLNALIDYSD